MRNRTNTMGKKLLHTFGRNLEGEIIHISDADNNCTYCCPQCGERMVLRKGGKTQRPHFAHFKRPPMKCNGTSVIRHLFREEATQILQMHLTDNLPFMMEWQCPYCSKKYIKDILQETTTVGNGYSINGFTPDIALCDKEGRIRIAIEILIQRKLTGKTLKVYEENGIILIQLKITENDAMNVKDKLHHPDSVSFCGNGECYNFQFCQSCFHREIFQQKFKCKKCGKVVDGYMVRNTSALGIIGLDNLREDEKRLIVSKFFSGKRTTVADIVVYGKCRCIPHSKGLICLTRSDYIKEAKKGKITKKEI